MAEKAEAPKAEDKPEAPPAEEKKDDAGSPKKAPKGRGKGGGKGRKGGKGGGAPQLSGMKSQLVEQVKANQRADPGWRRAWGNYCQQHGSDIRDPSKHAQSWLQRALSTLGNAQGGGYQGGYMQSRASPQVVEQIKMNQRADPGWNQAWANYCMMNGQGISDPSRHADRWLIRACHVLGPPQVSYQYMDSMGMIQTISVPMQMNYLPQNYGYQQRQQGGSYPRSRGGGYGGGGGAPRSRGGGYGGGKPRSRGGYSGGVPNLGQRGGLSRGGAGQRGGLRSRGGGGGIGSGGAPRSRGGGGGVGRPRSRGGYRPQ